VVDARGPESPLPVDAGYQKFLGQEIQLNAPHGLERPLLMDARGDQAEGFRFFYVLPLTPDRLLVEDTRFSESPALDPPLMREAILGYCEQAGWAVEESGREETGVLPMPWRGETPLPTRGPLRAGYRGGWFHPATGYSLPVAARLAETVAALAPDEVLNGGLRALQEEQQRQRAYCHLLNRMLFRWYPPRMRRHIFARFYRLPQERISRFYALRLNHADRARLLVGRPPRGLSLRYRLQTGVAS
jgi:lycopene beta-cyclase